MAWQERTVEIMREEFVKRALSMEKSKAALCREYGISRPTGDKWISRFLAGEPMSNQSRAPQIQARRVSAAVEADIVRMRQKYPALGAVKIRKIMDNDGYPNRPSARTINNIFHRNNLISKKNMIRFTIVQSKLKSNFNICCFPFDNFDSDYSTLP